jgi:hypothetical protein
MVKTNFETAARTDFETGVLQPGLLSTAKILTQNRVIGKRGKCPTPSPPPQKKIKKN